MRVTVSVADESSVPSVVSALREQLGDARAASVLLGVTVEAVSAN